MDLGIEQLTELPAGTIAHEEQHHNGLEDPNETWNTAVVMAIPVGKASDSLSGNARCPCSLSKNAFGFPFMRFSR